MARMGPYSVERPSLEGDLRADLRSDFEFFVEVEDLSDAPGGEAARALTRWGPALSAGATPGG